MEKYEILKASKLLVSNEEIIKFIKENEPNNILTDKLFFDWQFNKMSTGKNASYLAVIGSKIVGFLGVTESYFKGLGEETTLGTQSTNLIGQSQKPGIALSLLETLNKDYDINIGMNVSPHMFAMHYRLGYSIVELSRYICILSSSKLTGPYSVGFKKKIDKFQKKNDIKIIESELSEIKNMEISDEISILKDCKYIKNRFEMHPYFKYKCLKLKHDNAESYVIFRKIKLEDSITIMRVLELFSSAENYLHTINEVEKFAIENKYSIIEYFTTKDLRKYFIASSWINMDYQQAIDIPYLYSPVMSRLRNTINLALKTKNIQVKNINFTASDCDSDRPTKYGIKNLNYV
jgi:hypothetical protein